MGFPTILTVPDGGCRPCPSIAVPDCEDAATQAAQSAIAAEASAAQAAASAGTASSAAASANSAISAVQSDASAANASAVAAASSAAQAAASATSASEQAAASLASANVATTRASQASVSASNASTSASTAQAKATEAALSATISETHAEEALTSAQAAQNAAATTSAKVSEAAASAASALSSATAASGAALSAAGFASSAESSATAAGASAAEASSAGATAGAAAGATAGAEAAAPFAGAAEASATAAAASEASASSSASSAALSANAASSSASAASASAAAAATSQASALASASSASSSALVAQAVGVSLVAPYLSSRAPRPALITTGAAYVAASGPLTGALAHGAGGRLYLRVVAQRPSHGTLKYLVTHYASNLGWKLEWDASDILRLRVGNGSNFTTYAFPASAATGLPVNAYAVIELCADFGAGTLDYYLNGAKHGTTVNISAASAQTLDNTGQILWGSDGTTHLVGSLADGVIGKTALPTAQQIADAYRLGSLAPLCSWATNTTTGQQVPTLGSMVIVSWPDFGRADLVNNPIAQDRSGNNQHAALGNSGLTAAEPLTWRNTAPASVIVSDGSNGARIHNTLNNQNQGTGAGGPVFDGVYPQDATSSTTKMLSALTSNLTDPVQPRSLLLFYSSTNGLILRQYGATTSDLRDLTSLALHNQLAALGARGIPCALVPIRSGSSWRIYCGIGGDASRFFDATNLFTETTTGGSPPAWSDNIDGQYLVGFYRSSTASSAHALNFLALLNYAPTEAELRAAYARGWIVPEWQGASNTLLVDEPFDSTNGWSLGGSASIGSGVLTLAANADYAFKSGLFPRKLRQLLHISFDYVTADAGALTLPDYSHTPSFPGAVTNINLPVGAGTYSAIIPVGYNSLSPVGLEFRSGGWHGTLDNVRVKSAGFTTRLLASQAAGLTAPNAEAANGSTDFLISSSGVSVMPENRRQIIRPGTLTFTSPGTLNLQLFGASVVDTTKKWRIVSVSGTANGSANLSLGSASGGAQYISAQAVTSGDFDLGTFASRRLSGANLWLKSDATVTITDLVVILEQVN